MVVARNGVCREMTCESTCGRQHGVHGVRSAGRVLMSFPACSACTVVLKPCSLCRLAIQHQLVRYYIVYTVDTLSSRAHDQRSEVQKQLRAVVGGHTGQK